MEFLNRNLIKVDAEVQTAEEAIQAAGNLLLEEGLIEKKYIDAMVHSYEENGAYFVLAPSIAIPHARPEDGVKKASLSLVRLKEPVRFGHQTNDPVKIIFGLAAASSDEHLDLLKQLTGILNDKRNIEALMNAGTEAEVQKILKMEE